MKSKVNSITSAAKGSKAGELLEEIRTQINQLVQLDNDKIEERNATRKNIDNILEEDVNGEIYKHSFVKINECGSNVIGSYEVPDNDNVLLYAIVIGDLELSERFITDARSKLSPQEFQDFINYQFVPDKRFESSKMWINTALTLLLNRAQYDFAEKIMELSNDLTGVNEYGMNILHFLAYHTTVKEGEDLSKVLKLMGKAIAKDSSLLSYEAKGKYGSYKVTDFLLRPDLGGNSKILLESWGWQNYSTKDIKSLAYQTFCDGYYLREKHKESGMPSDEVLNTILQNPKVISMMKNQDLRKGIFKLIDSSVSLENYDDVVSKLYEISLGDELDQIETSGSEKLVGAGEIISNVVENSSAVDHDKIHTEDEVPLVAQHSVDDADASANH